MYRWIVFLHVISAFLFMMSHGAAAAVMFRLRRERDPGRVGAFLELARSNEAVTYICLLILLATGVTLGFLGDWWRHAWIWASLGTLVAIYMVMGYFGRGYFEPLIKALNPPDNPGHAKPAGQEELESLLSSGRPILMALVGVGGWLLVVWLMMFKPF